MHPWKLDFKSLCTQGLVLFYWQTVYNKDDFFDTLSCNTGDHDSQNGRTRFSEQLKIDAEVYKRKRIRI